jgi:hypothetical protein
MNELFMGVWVLGVGWGLAGIEISSRSRARRGQRSGRKRNRGPGLRASGGFACRTGGMAGSAGCSRWRTAGLSLRSRTGCRNHRLGLGLWDRRRTWSFWVGGLWEFVTVLA